MALQDLISGVITNPKHLSCEYMFFSPAMVTQEWEGWRHREDHNYVLEPTHGVAAQQNWHSLCVC